MGELVVLDGLAGVDAASDMIDKATSPVTAMCCIRCGGIRRSLLRIDEPVKGYVCKACVSATNSAIVKTGKGGKGRILVGPMADILAGMKVKR